MSALAVVDVQRLSGEHTCEPQPVQKRTSPRRAIYKTHWLTMSSAGGGFSSFLVAKLLDVSVGGFGVLTLEPVQPEHEYAVAGQIQVDEHWLEISGRARVAYCKPAEDGAYRVGLEASGIHCQSSPAPNQS